MLKYPPIIKDYPHFLHGGDYNPEQWLSYPGVIDEDFRIATLAHVNSLSVGIFSWAKLEPKEGHFDFGWLDDIMDRMARQNMKAVLATPSGAKPNWMAERYPEIRRIDRHGHREQQGHRHNHCFTSPVYREKVTIINTKLAERYKDHPALGIWHISNEFSGECHCDFCKAAFREWLKRKYTTLENLNHAWWAPFWSHSYTSWSQIDLIDTSVHGMVLDFRRFVSDQTADFIGTETAPLRRLTPNTPITTNYMGTFFWLDYRRLAKELDVISWDNYPSYHGREGMFHAGIHTSFVHDLNRSMKGGKPFMLMESCPSAVNWMQVNKLLKPGIHKLKSLQAVAHGADTVQYFQYRKSRGSTEKFHGAVIDHVGHTDTRVFREIAEVGETLQKIAPVLGTTQPAQAAIIFDWENRWILEEVAGPRKNMHEGFVVDNYAAFWSKGVAVDIIGMDDDFSKYKLLVAPMLYMLKPGVADRLRQFVHAGGTLVGTFLTGIADENDLCHLGGWPGGGLRELFGLWAEEIDYLYDDEKNRVILTADNPLGLSGEYEGRLACDLVHTKSAQVLATYGDDFYAGHPAITQNTFGSGTAYYLATRTDARFLRDFYTSLFTRLGLEPAIDAELPQGVTAQLRTDGQRRFIFLLNFTGQAHTIHPTKGTYTDLTTGQNLPAEIPLPPYGSLVLEAL